MYSIGTPAFHFTFRSGEFLTRWGAVERDILETGTYDLTFDELEYGVQLAWRNEPRCTARIQWGNLVGFNQIRMLHYKPLHTLKSLPYLTLNQFLHFAFPSIYLIRGMSLTRMGCSKRCVTTLDTPTTTGQFVRP